jgi:hypothetical protein
MATRCKVGQHTRARNSGRLALVCEAEGSTRVGGWVSVRVVRARRLPLFSCVASSGLRAPAHTHARTHTHTHINTHTAWWPRTAAWAKVVLRFTAASSRRVCTPRTRAWMGMGTRRSRTTSRRTQKPLQKAPCSREGEDTKRRARVQFLASLETVGGGREQERGQAIDGDG